MARTPRRYWLTISLPDRATKLRYERAVRLTPHRKLALWARIHLDQAAREELAEAEADSPGRVA